MVRPLISKRWPIVQTVATESKILYKFNFATSAFVLFSRWDAIPAGTKLAKSFPANHILMNMNESTYLGSSLIFLCLWVLAIAKLFKWFASCLVCWLTTFKTALTRWVSMYIKVFWEERRGNVWSNFFSTKYYVMLQNRSSFCEFSEIPPPEFSIPTDLWQHQSKQMVAARCNY